MKKLLTSALGIVALLACTAAAPGKQEVQRNLTIFNQLYKELATFYVDSLDARHSIETAIGAMLDEIDPYTEYIPESERDAFRRQTTGEYAGIGSYIMSRGGDTYISEPQEGSPAALAGLKPGDRIMVIDGDTMLGRNSQEVSERLRGQAGTRVKVTIERPYVGADSIKTFDITRRKIQEPSVTWSGIIDEPGGGIGYIHLSSFTERSPEEVKDALVSLNADPHLKGIIFDLRGNGGGLVESAVKILGYVLPKGSEVLRTRGRDALNEKIYKTSGQPIDGKVPLVILTDGGTASASEIVAGAIQDLDRGVIVGNRSFGKGLVQTSRSLPYDGLLKVTVAKYYIPSGRLIQAIDYSRRNADGSVARIPDSLTRVWHTASGRPVRDGGGITPDVTVDLPNLSRLVYTLVRDNWVFDYANRYAAEHAELGAAPLDYAVDDATYADFKASIDPARFQYDRPYESMLRDLREAIAVEGYMNDSVDSAMTELESVLHLDLDNDLDLKRRDVEIYLAPEIVSRYAGQRGRTQASLRDDTVVAEAIAILRDPTRYQQLLKP